MKFPRFVRVPQHRRFHMTTRYYDPIKEDINVRTENIRRELDNPKLANIDSAIRGSFERKVTRDSKAGIIRTILVLFMVGMLAGYIYLGEDIFYVFYLLIPVYLYFRFRGRMKRK